MLRYTEAPSRLHARFDCQLGVPIRNITEEQRDKLDDIVREMQRVGPERYLKASEVVDALISVLHGAREQLDMGMVRRRGKFGTQQHRMYREALAESIRVSITKRRTD